MHQSIFQRIHTPHGDDASDEWLTQGCAAFSAAGRPSPISWSRRNGPWHPVDVLFVGAAPGNAGGKGAGDMGAHATRIPFGGDIAGANLDVLLASAGLTRDDVFIVASLNRLPDAGGGEPTQRELAEPVGDYPSSVHLLRDTMLAVRPRLIVALGNVGLRTTIGAARLAADPQRERIALPSLAALKKAGIERGLPCAWPASLEPDAEFLAARGAPPPSLLWLTHPSAQNMSPYARAETAFYTRMVDARDALRAATRDVLGKEPPAVRADVPRRGDGRADSIYDLPEWRDAVGPRHAALAELWRSRGV